MVGVRRAGVLNKAACRGQDLRKDNHPLDTAIYMRLFKRALTLIHNLKSDERDNYWEMLCRSPWRRVRLSFESAGATPSQVVYALCHTLISTQRVLMALARSG